VSFRVDGSEYVLEVQDTTGQENYDRLRPLTYPKTDIFVVCVRFNVMFEREVAEHKWVPEISYHRPNIPFLVVGVKNVRDYDEKQAYDWDKKLLDPTDVGIKFAQRLGAVKYLECDVSTGEGVNEVFAVVSLTLSKSLDTC
jgi:small GTP-binding protein